MAKYNWTYICLSFCIGIVGLIMIVFFPEFNSPGGINIGWILSFFAGFFGMDAAKR